MLTLSLWRCFYVNDIAYGAKNDDSAFDLYVKSKRKLAERGFNLRKIVTNLSDLERWIKMSETRDASADMTNAHSVIKEDKTYTNLSSEATKCKTVGILWSVGVCVASHDSI